MRLRVTRSLLARVALIDEGQLDRLLIASYTASANSATCALSCSEAGVTMSASRWPSVSIAMCVLLPFRRLASFRGRLQRAAIENGRRRAGVAARCHPQQLSQVVDERREDASTQSPLRLLVDERPFLVAHVAGVSLALHALELTTVTSS